MTFTGFRVVIVNAIAAVIACGGDDSSGKSPSRLADAASDLDAAVAAVDAGGSSGRSGGGAATGGTTSPGGSGGASRTGGSGGSDGSGGGGGSAASGGSTASGGTPSTGGSGGRACLGAGAYCTWSTADRCCSGACDGDSCCGFLGDACQNGFGCCAGNCIDGYCRCPPGTLDCGGGCVDIEWNENRCGGCDTQCGDNSLCEQGTCKCDPNLFDAQFYEQCSDGCYNTRSDEQHCGNCTTVCTGGRQCSGGTCNCPGGTLDCGTGCVDITENPLHCGSCPNVCDAATETCVNRQCQCKAGLFACTPGVCVNRQTDESNCGSCGITCTGNKTCQGGDCLP